MIDQLTSIREGLLFYLDQPKCGEAIKALAELDKLIAEQKALAAMPQQVEVSDEEFCMAFDGIISEIFSGIYDSDHDTPANMLSALRAAGYRIIKDQPTKAPSEGV